jgi:hypothetical protein
MRGRREKRIGAVNELGSDADDRARAGRLNPAKQTSWAR